MDNCVFCRIVKGELPAVKVWENEDFLAMLDIYPNTPGMTVVLPKKHYDSYLKDMPDEVKGEFLAAAKTVCDLLDKGLGTSRTAIVMEGLGVDHAHFKLYPMHSLKNVPTENFIDEVFYNQYPGHVDTRHGPRADDQELNEIARNIKSRG